MSPNHYRHADSPSAAVSEDVPNNPAYRVHISSARERKLKFFILLSYVTSWRMVNDFMQQKRVETQYISELIEGYHAIGFVLNLHLQKICCISSDSEEVLLHIGCGSWHASVGFCHNERSRCQQTGIILQE